MSEENPDGHDLILCATNFNLGHKEDDDRRPYVNVSRQYGSALYPICKWVVYDVTESGVQHTSKAEFDDVHEALGHGWTRLAALRSSD